MRNNINTRFIINVLKPFRLWIFLQSIGGIVWAIDLSFRPYLLKVIIDALAVGVQNGAVNLLLVPLCLYVCISLLVVILFRLYDLSWLRILAPMKAYVVSVLTNNIMLHSLTKNKRNFSGSMSNIINDVMNGIPEILKIVVDKFFTQFLAAGIAIATVATIGIVYAGVLTVWLLGFIFGSIYSIKRLKKRCYNSHKNRSVVFAQISDIISNVAAIRMFATRKFEAMRLQQLLDDSIKVDQDRDMSFMIIAAFQGLTFVIYQAICLVLLVIGFKHGIVSAGDFVLLLNYEFRSFSN